MSSPNRVKLGPEHQPPDFADPWPLFCAAANGELETVKQILRSTPELMHCFLHYECPLHYAIRGNHVEVVRALLDAQINPAFSNFQYFSWPKLLLLAEERGFDELHAMLVVEMQKRFAYDPDYKPLWQAMEQGDSEAVRKLITTNPKLVHLGDAHGNRALHWAILCRRIPIIQMLLDEGADINAKRADFLVPLHLAIAGYEYWFNQQHHYKETPAWEVAEYIRDQGADYDFFAAVAFNDIDRVKAELAENKALANQLTASRRSPLNAASTRGHLEMVRLLLEHGADPNQPEHLAPKGHALFEASAQNNIEIMTVLLEHGALADAESDSSGTCLSIAKHGQRPREVEAVALLEKYLAAIAPKWKLDSAENVATALDDPTVGQSPRLLCKILEFDDVELLTKFVERFGTDAIGKLNPGRGWHIPKSEAMVAALVSHGLDIDTRDWCGRTYLFYVASDETPERAGWMLNNGANINAIATHDGTTPLGRAAERGRLEVVEFLLHRGADVRLPNEVQQWGQPLTLAKKNDHQQVIERLAQAERG